MFFRYFLAMSTPAKELELLKMEKAVLEARIALEQRKHAMSAKPAPAKSKSPRKKVKKDKKKKVKAKAKAKKPTK